MANMDSLKLPKTGSNSGSPSNTGNQKISGSIPITVRFNAGDECIDDLLSSFHHTAGVGGVGTGTSGGGGSSKNSGSGSANISINSGSGDSLSSSPSQHTQAQTQPQNVPEEINTRNNFLQSNFFNRKRSGSIEGVSPTSTGPNLIAALSGGDATPVGTWKLFKGKVSQTIEEIKSSTAGSQALPTVIIKGEAHNDADSDPENATPNNPASDELSLDLEPHPHPHHRHSSRGSHHRDSDSDETEISYEGDGERSRLRRGLANLKSKVRAKSAAHHQSPVLLGGMKKETSPTRSAASSTTSLRAAFLRKRRRDPVDASEQAAAPATELTVPVPPPPPPVPGKPEKKRGIIAGKKIVEIESGVEMLEDTIPSPTKEAQSDVKAGGSKVAPSTDPTTLERHSGTDIVDERTHEEEEEALEVPLLVKASTESLRSDSSGQSLFRDTTSQLLRFLSEHLSIFAVVCLAIVLKLPMHDFIRGVLACLLTIICCDSLWSTLEGYVEKYLVTHPPEKTKFTIPEYTKMSICEVPAVEEHKTVKSYEGWMNEVTSYDPNNFHITMSKSVYVRLEGTILRLADTVARVPKKVMWNEPHIDLKTISFTDHRAYNMLDCRVELLPVGLARKRYFNRKYPIQLIIKNCVEQRYNLSSDESLPSLSKWPSTASKEDVATVDLERQQSWASFYSVPSETSIKPSGSEQTEERADRTQGGEKESDLDFANTILNANLQALQDAVNPDMSLKDITVPCGDEVRLLLFSRGDREKEDWYRRFVAASTGEVLDQDLHLPNLRLVSDKDMQAAAAKAAILLTEPNYKSRDSLNLSHLNDDVAINSESTVAATIASSSPEIPKPEKRNKTDESPEKEDFVEINTDDFNEDNHSRDKDSDPFLDEGYEGLLMSACAARNPVDYIRFMALYQSACNDTHIPIFKEARTLTALEQRRKRHRREKQQEDDLWKGIDQSLFLGPSGSVVWANVLIGRVIYSCLKDTALHDKIQEFLQKKINSIKLPSFMEDVVITQIYLGETPPLIHRVSQPVLDERGTWVDADLTYEGLSHITVTTKLNLMRLKRAPRPPMVDLGVVPTVPPAPLRDTLIPNDSVNSSSASLIDDNFSTMLPGSAIFDSDAESSGGSSSEAESPVHGAATETNPTNDFNVFQPSQGKARRIFKIVDRITASNFFQYATELSYVQRAMENMSANITLRVDLKGLVSRATINIPPPPSDRVWLSFRGPPRLWISAKPTLGDKSVDWSIVTNVIESKLCEEVNKYLVYPNMVDITIPFLGQSTYYKE